MRADTLIDELLVGWRCSVRRVGVGVTSSGSSLVNMVRPGMRGA